MDSEDSTLDNTSSRPALREIHSNEVQLNSNLLSPSSKQSPNKFLQPQQRQQPPVDASLNLNSNFHGNSVAVGSGLNQLNVENTQNDADSEKIITNPFMGLMTIDSSELPELPECLNPNFADHLRTPSRDSIVLALANDLNSGLDLNETNKGDFEKIDLPKEPAEASSDNEIFDECQSYPFLLANSTEHIYEDAFSSALNSKNNTMTATQLEVANSNGSNEVEDPLDIDSFPLPPQPAQWENVPDSEQFSKLATDNLERNLNSNDTVEIVGNVTFSNNEYCTNESGVAFTEEQCKGDKLETNVIVANLKEDSELNTSQKSEQDVFNETFDTICTDKSPENELKSLKEELPSSNELTETLPTLRSFPMKLHTDNLLFPQLTDECQKHNVEFLKKSDLNDCLQNDSHNEVVSNEEDIAKDKVVECVKNESPTASNQMDINETDVRNVEPLFEEGKSDKNLPPVLSEKISSHEDFNDPTEVASGIANEVHDDHEQNLNETIPVADVPHNLYETIDPNKETVMELSQNLNETIDMETDASLNCEIKRKSEVSDISPTNEQNKDTSLEQLNIHPQPNATDLTSLEQSVAELQLAISDNIMNRTFASSSSNRNALNLEDFQFEEMVIKNNSELRAKNANLSPKISIKVNKKTINICNTPGTPKNSQYVEPMDVDEIESPALPIGRQQIPFSASSTSPTLLSAKEKSKCNLFDEKDVNVDQQNIKSPFDKETFQSQSLADTFAFPTSSAGLAEEQKMTDEFTEEDFHSNRIFFNPSDFDFLLTKGNNNVHVDRSSLLLRFDPLLGHSVPVNIGNSNSNNETLPPIAGSTLAVITSNNNNNNNSNRLSPANEEDEFFINDTNKVFNLESKNKVQENQIISEEGAKLLDSSRQKEKQIPITSSSEQENNLKSSGKGVKKNAKMSVDVIQDLKIDNDCKSIENNHNSQLDEKQIFKMDELEKKIKNEVLKTEDIEKKLKEAEQREEALIKRITEKDKNIAKMNTVIEAYEKAIAELIAEKEQLIQKYQKELTEVKADRDSNYHHLTSLETTFSDLHVKYEKSKEMTAQLKTSEGELLAEKRKNLENLRLQEQRYEKMKNHAMQQLEIANKKLETFTRNHAMESTKLKALLKKEEISRASISEQLQQKSRENEELVKICDELINGQGS